MDVSSSFGDWIRRRRKALDLTQVELAGRVSCSVITIQKIEAGARRPSRQIAERLADQLAIPPHDRATFVQAARAELAAPAHQTDRAPMAPAEPDRPPAHPRARSQGLCPAAR